jgi:hypothetical protein
MPGPRVRALRGPRTGSCAGHPRDADGTAAFAEFTSFSAARWISMGWPVFMDSGPGPEGPRRNDSRVFP